MSHGHHVEKTHDLADASLMRTVAATTTVDACGNATEVTVATANGAGTEELRVRTVNTYADNADFDLIEGRLTQSVVTHTRGGSSRTRTSRFEYDRAMGILIRETVEPNTDVQLVTS